MAIEIVESPIVPGDSLVIHGTDAKGDPVYASVEYLGRTRDKGYRFESETYGWMWFMNRQKTEIWCERTPDIHYPVDNRSGWLRFIPN